MSYVWPNGKFLIFPFQFGSLAIKSHSILGNFTIGPASYTKMVSYVWSNVKFLIFPPLVWCNGCQSHGILGNFAVFPPKSAICLNCQNKFINLIHYHIAYTVAITTWVSWVSNTPFLGKMPCNTIIIRGTVLAACT